MGNLIGDSQIKVVEGAIKILNSMLGTKERSKLL